MKIKALTAIIIIGLVLAFAYHFKAIASIDAPHNESSNISCGSCHGEGLLQSFWGGSGLYSTIDELCLSCHKRPFGPYTDDDAPVVQTHHAPSVILAECVHCHDPHYQKQKNYKNTDADNLYLATGDLWLPCNIFTCVYNSVTDTTKLRYLSISYKSGWDGVLVNMCVKSI
jgi:hypothetical protein